MNDDQAIAAFAALGHEIRFTIWRMLLARGGEGLSAGILAKRLGISASTLSFHARTLVLAGLMRQRRVQRNFVYAVEPQLLLQLTEYLRLGMFTGSHLPGDGLRTCSGRTRG